MRLRDAQIARDSMLFTQSVGARVLLSDLIIICAIQLLHLYGITQKICTGCRIYYMYRSLASSDDNTVSTNYFCLK